MVAADSYVAQIFADGCWSTGRAAKYCVSDEHYVPTLLAWHGEGGRVCGPGTVGTRQGGSASCSSEQPLRTHICNPDFSPLCPATTGMTIALQTSVRCFPPQLG